MNRKNPALRFITFSKDGQVMGIMEYRTRLPGARRFLKAEQKDYARAIDAARLVMELLVDDQVVRSLNCKI